MQLTQLNLFIHSCIQMHRCSARTCLSETLWSWPLLLTLNSSGRLDNIPGLQWTQLCSIFNSSLPGVVVQRLKKQNDGLFKDLDQKSKRISQLENEKAVLIRELFDARAQASDGYIEPRNTSIDKTFMWGPIMGPERNNSFRTTMRLKWTFGDISEDIATSLEHLDFS